MARAVIEGVSYSLYSALELIDRVGVPVNDMSLCGGGAKSGLWRQMLSDVYAVDIKIPESGEGAALGAAILGGCAAGIYSSVEEGCERAVRTKTTVLSNNANHEEYMKHYAVYSSLYPALSESFLKLSKI